MRKEQFYQWVLKTQFKKKRSKLKIFAAHQKFRETIFEKMKVNGVSFW